MLELVFTRDAGGITYTEASWWILEDGTPVSGPYRDRGLAVSDFKRVRERGKVGEEEGMIKGTAEGIFVDVGPSFVIRCPTCQGTGWYKVEWSYQPKDLTLPRVVKKCLACEDGSLQVVEYLSHSKVPPTCVYIDYCDGLGVAFGPLEVKKDPKHGWVCVDHRDQMMRCYEENQRLYGKSFDQGVAEMIGAS